MARLGAASAAITAMVAALSMAAVAAPAVHAAASAPFGQLFAGSDDGFVYSFDSRTGIKQWRTRVGRAVQTTPVVDTVAGRLYVGSGPAGVPGIGQLTCLTTTGAMVFNVTFPGPVVANPVLWRDHGVVFAATSTGDSHLYSVNAATGAEIFRVETDGDVVGTPAVGGPFRDDLTNRDRMAVMFGTTNGQVYGIWADAEETPAEKQMFRLDMGGTIQGPAAVWNNEWLWIGSEEGVLYGINAATQEVVHSLTTPDQGTRRVRTRPLFFEQRRNFSEGAPMTSMVAIGNSKGFLATYEAMTGERVVAADRGGFIKGSMHFATAAEHQSSLTPNGTIIAAFNAAAAGEVATLKAIESTGTGEPIWARNLDSDGSSGGVLVQGSVVYVADDAGTLYCISLTDGSVVWTNLPSASARAANKLMLPAFFPGVGPAGNQGQIQGLAAGFDTTKTVSLIFFFLFFIWPFVLALIGGLKVNSTGFSGLRAKDGREHDSRLLVAGCVQAVLSLFLAVSLWAAGIGGVLMAAVGVYAGMWRDVRATNLYLYLTLSLWFLIMVVDFAILDAELQECYSFGDECGEACEACSYTKWLIFISTLHLIHAPVTIFVAYKAGAYYAADKSNRTAAQPWGAVPRMMLDNVRAAVRGQGAKLSKPLPAGGVTTENPLPGDMDTAVELGGGAAPPPPSRAAPPPPPGRAAPPPPPRR